MKWGDLGAHQVYLNAMSDGDYLLGTQDIEVERLGLQHRVWRSEMMSGLDAARFSEGETLLDIGAGPGHATADLANIAGPSGKVIALERAPHFLDTLRDRKLANVDVREIDLVEEEIGEGIADAAWTRWVLAFLADPSPVVAKIARALKPGGRAVFHEYLDYEAWRLIPQPPAHRHYRDLVVKSWRDTGGDPDAALQLPQWLADAGMEVVSMRPIVRIIEPDDPMWEWPQSFMATNAYRLRDLGYCSDDEAAEFSALLDHPAPGTRMLTPVVAEVIAIKR